MKRTSGFLLGAFTLAVALPCAVFGSERVTMQSPAKDAAYVSLLPGMVNNHKLKSYLGTAHTANDGIVIRQSYIKDGKIIIPPGGLLCDEPFGKLRAVRGQAPDHCRQGIRGYQQHFRAYGDPERDLQEEPGHTRGQKQDARF